MAKLTRGGFSRRIIVSLPPAILSVALLRFRLLPKGFLARRKNPLAGFRSDQAPVAEQGFTLIEVMIAVALLAFVSIMIAQATTRSFNINLSLGRESTEYSGIILSLRAVESDLTQIYSPTLDTEGPAVAPPATNSPLSQASFWSQPLRADGLRRARLAGTGEKITFINNGARRVEADSPVSDFQKVTWEIERNDTGAYSLYRTVDTDAFSYEENTMQKKPSRVAVLENLSSGKFSYYRRENKTWEEQWDSESSFAKPTNRFPDLIRLKIEVPDPLNNANNQPWELVIRPNMPLNGEQKPLESELMGQ